MTANINRETLEARWDAALVAPWRPGYATKLWADLHNDLSDLVMRVAMVTEEDIQEIEYGSIVERLFTVIHKRLMQELEGGNLARTGYEGIGSRDVDRPLDSAA